MLLRRVLAIPLGLAVAFLGIIGVEAMSAVLHPVPPGTDLADIEACKAHVARYPAAVLVLVVFTWGLTVFVSTWLAVRLGRQAEYGIVVGTILLAAVAFNMAMLPYPVWFWVNLIVFPVCTWWAVSLARSS